MMRALFAAFALALAGSAAASGAAHLPYQFEPDTGNQSSLQRGARNYVNYCAGCHSMKHLRFSRLGEDLGIPEGVLKTNLMFGTEKVGDSIMASLPAESAKWFGQVPPDLSVGTRKRGPDWVYNYLMTFYLDPSRPNGVNNLVLPGASMPHVLWELQGWQTKNEAPADEGDGHGAKAPLFTQAEPGKLSPDEYKKFVADTVNFMHYAAEPARAKRITTGIGTLLFLLVLTVLSYFMYKEWWRGIH